MVQVQQTSAIVEYELFSVVAPCFYCCHYYYCHCFHSAAICLHDCEPVALSLNQYLHICKWFLVSLSIHIAVHKWYHTLTTHNNLTSVVPVSKTTPSPGIHASYSTKSSQPYLFPQACYKAMIHLLSNVTNHVEQSHLHERLAFRTSPR